MTELTMRISHWQAMVDHVRRYWPEEACGLLGGPPGQVEVLYLVENILHSPVAYEMDPHTQVEAMVELEGRGWDVVGIFHSHPGGPPAPSPTDVSQAYYPDAAYVILSPTTSGEWQAKGFSVVDGAAKEIPLVVSE